MRNKKQTENNVSQSDEFQPAKNQCETAETLEVKMKQYANKAGGEK